MNVIEGLLLGLIFGLIISYPLIKTQSKNIQHRSHVDVKNTDIEKNFMMKYWTVRLAIAFFGLGAFYAFVLGSRAVGFMIGFGIAMSLIGIVIGFIIDIIKSKMKP